MRGSRPGMVDRASVNGRGTARVPGSPSAEYEGVAEFVDDLTSLAELQARLAAIDFRDAARKSAVPIVLTVVGLTVVVASVPVALLGAGWLTIQRSGFLPRQTTRVANVRARRAAGHKPAVLRGRPWCVFCLEFFPRVRGHFALGGA